MQPFKSLACKAQQALAPNKSTRLSACPCTNSYPASCDWFNSITKGMMLVAFVGAIICMKPVLSVTAHANMAHDLAEKRCLMDATPQSQ